MSYPPPHEAVRKRPHDPRPHARIDHIVEHYSGTLASARNNATHFARNERQGASAHLFVHDISEEIYQSVAEGDTAWHAGDWDMNCRSIGIEIISAGEYGNGAERKRKLGARYEVVQKRVNELLSRRTRTCAGARI